MIIQKGIFECWKLNGLFIFTINESWENGLHFDLKASISCEVIKGDDEIGDLWYFLKNGAWERVKILHHENVLRVDVNWYAV